MILNLQCMFFERNMTTVSLLISEPVHLQSIGNRGKGTGSRERGWKG